MANNSTYQIIDEPKTRFMENLIINPVLILFAAMIIPLFVKLPYFGRWWLPFVWLIFNGIILGSPRIKREVLFSIIALSLLTALFFLIGHLYSGNPQYTFSVANYIVILMQAVFFFFLYLVVFSQESAYNIYQYTKGQ